MRKSASEPGVGRNLERSSLNDARRAGELRDESSRSAERHRNAAAGGKNRCGQRTSGPGGENLFQIATPRPLSEAYRCCRFSCRLNAGFFSFVLVDLPTPSKRLCGRNTPGADGFTLHHGEGIDLSRTGGHTTRRGDHTPDLESCQEFFHPRPAGVASCFRALWSAAKAHRESFVDANFGRRRTETHQQMARILVLNILDPIRKAIHAQA